MGLDRGMDNLAGSLVTAFDYVWERLTGRLGGLTDEEYFWEPVAGCWSLRQDEQGRWRLDGGGGGGPAPDPAPVTTIAWRLGHLGGLAVGGFADQPEADRRPRRSAWSAGEVDAHDDTADAGAADFGEARVGERLDGADV